MRVRCTQSCICWGVKPWKNQATNCGVKISATMVLATSTVVITVMTTVLVASTIVAEIFTPQFVAWFFHGFTPQQMQLCVHLTRILLPAQIFFYVGGVVSAVLLSHR